VEDRESGIESISYRIVDRENAVVLEGVADVKKRYALGTKRRKRVRKVFHLKYGLEIWTTWTVCVSVCVCLSLYKTSGVINIKVRKDVVHDRN